MEAPLKGIRVLEVANWLAIPSCAAMMADMGADVIKVEALQGDTFRTEIRDADFGKAFPISYAFELDNRGKRSIALNLARPKAVEAVHKLASKADVFMTNLIPRRQEAFNLTYEELSKDHPASSMYRSMATAPKAPTRTAPASTTPPSGLGPALCPFSAVLARSRSTFAPASATTPALPCFSPG